MAIDTGPRYASIMKTSFGMLVLTLGLAVSGTGGGAAARQDTSGRLATLPDGFWLCGTPGTAMDTPFHADDNTSFVTRLGSSYRTAAGRGTYLLTGETLTFTRGPLQGLRLVREEENRLRGDPSSEQRRLVCNRQPRQAAPFLNDPSTEGTD